MMFEVLRYLGVITGAWLLRRRIDQTGSKPFFLLALVLYAMVAVLWLLFLNGLVGSSGALFGIYFVVGLGAVCWNLANMNYLPQIVPAEDRALCISIFAAVTSFLGGCSPIFWGLFLKGTNADGTPGIDAGMFQWFFICLLVSVTILSVLVSRLQEDIETEFEPIIIGNALLRPFRAATYLVNLIDLKGLARDDDAPPKSADD
jgi:hypothetical protein